MSWADNHVLTIQTPEGVTFRLPLAGPVTRMLACMLDMLISGGIAAILQNLLKPLASLGPIITRQSSH